LITGPTSSQWEAATSQQVRQVSIISDQVSAVAGPSAIPGLYCGEVRLAELLLDELPDWTCGGLSVRNLNDQS
jgi:hypothetical protein